MVGGVFLDFRASRGWGMMGGVFSDFRDSMGCGSGGWSIFRF